MNHNHIGSNFDDFLAEEGMLEEVSLKAHKRLLTLQIAEITARDGTPVRLIYDEETDILEIFFGENGTATGVELTENMILRLDRQTQRAFSLTLLHFSVLSDHTEYGPRSFPLNKLERLPQDLKELVLRLITSLPVSQFLKLSQFQASPVKRLPVAYVEAQPFVGSA